MQPMSPGMENMSQLEFGPTNFFNTRRCSIARDGVPIGEIERAMIGQNASIAIGGARYAAARENISRGTYYLAAANGTRLANAEKPYAFERLFTVRFGARTITLRAMAALGRAYVLTENGIDIGSILRRGFFGRKFDAEIPDDLPPELEAFLVWLVLALWRRQLRAGAATAIAGPAAAAAGRREPKAGLIARPSGRKQRFD